MVGLVLACAAFSEPSLQLKDGDRIALLGDTLIERSQKYGFLEFNLLVRFPDAKLRFRNIAWSADTTAGLSRGYFDPPERARQRLSEHVQSVNPTVIVLGYGMAESFEGRAGLARFRENYQRLIAEVRAGDRRLLFLSPTPHAALGPPLPDPAAHNQSLARYSEAIRDLACANSAAFVDLFQLLSDGDDGEVGLPGFTSNGIHLTALGYWLLALEIERSLGFEPQPIVIDLDHRGLVLSTQNAAVTVLASDHSKLIFNCRENRLPTAEAPRSLNHPQATTIQLRIRDLPEGNYLVSIDRQKVRVCSREELAVGVTLKATPQHAQAAKLVALIRQKNAMYFNSYRPQNITYLLGFRKYEQGQNAKELDKLRAAVEALDESIHALKKPQSHEWTIERTE